MSKFTENNLQPLTEWQKLRKAIEWLCSDEAGGWNDTYYKLLRDEYGDKAAPSKVKLIVDEYHSRQQKQNNPELNPAKELENSFIDPIKEYNEPPIVLKIESGRIAPVCTLGNFSLVIGKAKSKKTFAITGAISAAAGTPTLSFIGCLPERAIVLLFDTEQSEYHVHKVVRRICRLIGIYDPINFKGYGLRKYTPAERLALIEYGILNTPNLGFVVIDGIRDLLTKGINDEEEATALTSKFLRWTAERNIHLMLVLHQNKGDLNARGHIGTECINKAETVFSVTKLQENSDISIVEAEFCRDIEFNPFAFTIDNSGLPQLCDMPQTEKEVKRSQNPENISDQEHFEILNAIYKQSPEPLFSDLRDGIIYGFHGAFGQNKARNFIAHYLASGWVQKERKGMKVIYTYKRALF